MSEQIASLSWLIFSGMSAVFLGFVALLQSEHSDARLRQRMGRAAGHKSLRHARRSGSAKHLAKSLRATIAQIGERFAVILGGEARTTQDDLLSAGFSGRDALLIYAFVKTVLPVGVLVLGLIYVAGTHSISREALVPAAMVVALALAISKAVDFAVDFKRTKRLEKIRHGFPDMLELLVITSEAGLGPQPALHRVAKELHQAHPELAKEILQMVSEMRMTNNRRAAYEKLNVRVPLPEIGVFTQTLEQSDIYGTPFSRAMRVLITDQRSDRLLRVEEKAARLPVIMTVPLIFCIMPAVFIVLVGPAVLSVFDNIIAGG